MMNKFVFLDFEFNSTNEKYLNLVCVAWEVWDGERCLIRHSEWLLNDQMMHDHVAKVFTRFNDRGFVFVCYGTAEPRSFISLGLNPNDFRWIDQLNEYKQLKNHNGRLTYGNYLDKNGNPKKSVPPWINPRKDNTKVGHSLANALHQLLNITIDTDHKTLMRDIIIEGDDDRIQENKIDILKYCESDVVYMPKLFDEMIFHFRLLLNGEFKHYYDTALVRGAWSSDLAKMESVGIPLEMECLMNLSNNYDDIIDTLIQRCVDVYPFWVKVRKTKKSEPVWVKKYDQFKTFVESKGRADSWELTDAGKYSAERDTLKIESMTYPEIKILKETNDIIQQLKWFRPVALPEFLENVGSDNCLRPYFNPYGTQSGRNAPPAKTFIFAMSSWLRSLIRPPEGHSVVSIDYGSQEFILAGILSGDDNMIDAYASGDPYLYFSKKAGAVPEHGTKTEYAEERKMFKATTLGLQYGMRAKSLSAKLSVDMGKTITEREAEKLIKLHQKVYPKYWKWLDKIEKSYRTRPLKMIDGWYMFKDNKSKLSVLNAPTQGNAQAILRVATRKAHDKGCQLIAPLHDALYMICRDDQVDEHTKILNTAMIDAVNEMVGDYGMRTDIEIHDRDHIWIEEKAETMYNLLGKYLGGRHVENLEND
jgi:hypothetical protein